MAGRNEVGSIFDSEKNSAIHLGMRSLRRSLFLPAIVLGLLAMASAYTAKGSRGYAADPKVVAAATLIYTATAAGRSVPSAPDAMRATNLFTERQHRIHQ